MIEKITAKGKFHVEHWRGNKCLAIFDFQNMITNLGKNLMLGRMFNNNTSGQTANWYIGIIGNTGFSAVSVNDTMSSHGGWQEYQTLTGLSARPSWSQGSASGQQVVNASAVSVTLTNVDIIQGIFIVDNAVFAPGTDGNLWSTALFPTPLANQSGDILKLTYAIQM